jgi:3-oxoacyl-[acyl-carrier protein] reductase
MIAPIPLGRAASAEEVAGPALFLASEQLSSFITGEVIEVNGGALMA